MPKRIMLIDGNSLTYRAFHALPADLTTSSGQVTNAVLGFTNMLIYLVKDHKPDAIAVAWDRKEPTFRHKRVDTYKANRSETPSILIQQLGLVKEVLDAIKIPQIEKSGFEADDILATLATQSAKLGNDTLVVTGDRDSYQLVEDPHIRVVYNKRGVSDYALYDEAGILARTGVTPANYVQYAALRGDPSDNLPGVMGVGEKTAAKLINTYGGIDGIYEAVEDQTPKLQENLKNSELNVRLNVELMKLIRDVELELDAADLVELKEYNPDDVQKIFDLLEFKNVHKRLAEAFGRDAIEENNDSVELEAKYEVVSTTTEISEYLTSLVSDAQTMYIEVSGDACTIAGSSQITDIAICSGSSSDVMVAAFNDLKQVDAGLLEECFGAKGPGIVTHNSKPLVRGFAELDIDLNLTLDTSIAGYLLNPAGNSKYEVADLLKKYTNYMIADSEEDTSGQLSFDELVPDAKLPMAARVAGLRELGPVLTDLLEKQNLIEIMQTMELPLAKALARMEQIGVTVDRKILSTLCDEMTAEVSILSKKIQEQAGEEFNVNSTKVLQRILFEKLELTPQKKTKTGYSTDQGSLEKLRDDHEIIESLLSYREVEKLRSTYGKPLLNSISEDGRIHATFRQTVARTGRLSSENPNLHNIPIRSELGKKFRGVFTAPKGKQLLVADYNQIELRCIAHLTNDPGLVEAFRTNADIHTETAAKIFNIEPGDVTSEQRNQAKMVSYGLAYGMEAFGLSQRLKISTGEAKVFLDAFFDNFPSVKQYMDDTVAQAKELGYTETLFGRRRAIPELLSNNRNVRMAAERQAMNSGIQGLAADIFKIAIVKIDQALQAADVRSQLVLQVHDEVILEVDLDESKIIEELVVSNMESAFEMSVPLPVNLSFASSWEKAKG